MFSRFQVGGFDVLAVPVLRDNFVFLVCRDGNALLIDAGDADPVFKALEQEQLQLQGVLITHAHHDHNGGCRAIQDRLGVLSTSPGVEAGQNVFAGTVYQSVSTPGHVSVHKCFYFPELGMLFTGDTLINGACGRILGGTASQLFASLQWIKSLPDETRIFGGHDYLMGNMEFARSVEPENTDIQDRIDRYHNDPVGAVFVTLAEEKKTNPFLRVDTLDAFVDLRRAKDDF